MYFPQKIYRCNCGLESEWYKWPDAAETLRGCCKSHIIHAQDRKDIKAAATDVRVLHCKQYTLPANYIKQNYTAIIMRYQALCVINWLHIASDRSLCTISSLAQQLNACTKLTAAVNSNYIETCHAAGDTGWSSRLCCWVNYAVMYEKLCLTEFWPTQLAYTSQNNITLLHFICNWVCYYSISDFFTP